MVLSLGLSQLLVFLNITLLDSALNEGMEYVQYFIIFQYVSMALVFIYWFYTRRVKSGFRVIFCVSSEGIEHGSYRIDDDKANRFVIDFYDAQLQQKKLEEMPYYDVVSGVPEIGFPMFIGEREVKAGQAFVSFEHKGYLIPWNDIAFQQFHWKYMIIDVTQMKNYTLGGECLHTYSPRDVENVDKGCLFKPFVEAANLRAYLPVILMAVIISCMITAIVTYGVTSYVVNQSYVGWVPAETRTTGLHLTSWVTLNPTWAHVNDLAMTSFLQFLCVVGVGLELVAGFFGVALVFVGYSNEKFKAFVWFFVVGVVLLMIAFAGA